MIGNVNTNSSAILPSIAQRFSYTRVVAKKKIGIYVDAVVAERLDAMSEKFEGLKGELVAAALTMFMNASDDQKRHALQDVMTAKVDRLFDMEPKGSQTRSGRGTIGPAGAKRQLP